MTYARGIFFGCIRPLFGGKLKPTQVAGLEAILDAAPDGMPVEHLAYCLATAKHETAHTMQPIEEYGRGAGKKYGVKDPETGHAYFGRGYVQLTWKSNYARAKAELGTDFVKYPALALDPHHAATIMFQGMSEGWFTGKRLSHYLSPTVNDPVNARRIINGTDKAQTIAAYHAKFLAALRAARATSDAVDHAPTVTVHDTPQVHPAPARPPAHMIEADPGFWGRLRRAFGD